MRVELEFSGSLSDSDPAKHPTLLIGRVNSLQALGYEPIKCKLHNRVSKETYMAALASLQTTDTCPLWLNRATLASLPNQCSRHNSSSRPHALTKIIKQCAVGGEEYIVVVCSKPDVFAYACAVARAFPRFSRKSYSEHTPIRIVHVEFKLVSNSAGIVPTLTTEDLRCLTITAIGVRMTARITDQPCAEMHTDAFLDDIREVGKKLGITPMIIQGKELSKQGFGGLYAVGMGASNKPALAVLSHLPNAVPPLSDEATPTKYSTISWVGKGVVYDTGGLSIKGKSTMPGMKRDCGGAAAVLGAFYAAVKMGFKDNLHAVLCLAENAVGPDSLRPDDIITMYSGRTVEVNNTDAEGRLVLGDGVAYAGRDLKSDIIVDIATLTGAQGPATGRYHAALVTNSEKWESLTVSAGKSSGDLVHPMIYCPELHFSEFASAVADMKNSGADRLNSEVSCAGLFVGSHVGFDFPGVWIHLDMAYPAYTGERATGYGVGLLLTMFANSSYSQLLQSIGPMYVNPTPTNQNRPRDDKYVQLANSRANGGVPLPPAPPLPPKPKVANTPTNKAPPASSNQIPTAPTNQIPTAPKNHIPSDLSTNQIASSTPAAPVRQPYNIPSMISSNPIGSAPVQCAATSIKNEPLEVSGEEEDDEEEEGEAEEACDNDDDDPSSPVEKKPKTI